MCVGCGNERFKREKKNFRTNPSGRRKWRETPSGKWHAGGSSLEPHISRNRSSLPPIFTRGKVESVFLGTESRKAEPSTEKDILFNLKAQGNWNILTVTNVSFSPPYYFHFQNSTALKNKKLTFFSFNRFEMSSKRRRGRYWTNVAPKKGNFRHVSFVTQL